MKRLLLVLLVFQYEERDCCWAFYGAGSLHAFQLWLFLDNHDLNRFLFECNGDRKMLQEAINYTRKWHKPFLIYYGTEKGMSNETDVHQMAYGDEQVRKPMIWD